jgi:hypothetical protein
MEIQVGDIILHQLSKLYFICENKKMQKWMNENKFYQKVPRDTVPIEYFKNSAKK